MGVITPDRFNPIKAFCNVRLQQGVPLVDADINELDDIRKFEVRAFLKWFVGNGNPAGNDGFRIVAASQPAVDDFVISAGAQLAAAGAPPDTSVSSQALNEFSVAACGRCIVDGLDVIIRSDISYKSQPLYHGQSGAQALAAAYGVPVIADIPTLAATGAVAVYLDVWERMVAPSEDSALVVPPLGTESCARMKREWVVRTMSAAGGAPPPVVAGLPHHYYLLAIFRQRIVNGAPQLILPTDIKDAREQGLLIPPATLSYDTLGMSAVEYRLGKGRPLVSLRAALNALLQGDVPATDEIAVTADPSNDQASYAFIVDNLGVVDNSIGLNAIWASNRNSNTSQIFTARLASADLESGFTGLATITNPTSSHVAPSATALPNGSVIVAYSTSTVAPANVFFKHGPSLGGMTTTTPAEIPVVSASSVAQRAPFVVATGDASGGTVVFFFHESTATPRWVYQRRKYTSTWDETGAMGATWTDPQALSLSNASANPSPATMGEFHAAPDGAGNVWAAYCTPTDHVRPPAIQIAQLTIATNALTAAVPLYVPGSGVNSEPFVMADATGNRVWVFWNSGQGTSTPGIYAQTYERGSMKALVGPTLIPDTSEGTHSNPCAVQDPTGTIWLFWASDRGGRGSRIWFNRCGTLGWGAARPIMSFSSNDVQPFAMLGPNGNIWLFWRRVVSDANSDLYFKQLLNSI